MRPIDVILKAAVEASEDLEDWHLDEWSNVDRNEQWIHSYLAIRLNDYARKEMKDRTSVLVTLESKVSWLNRHCGKSSKSGPKDLTPGQRFDIAVWGDEGIEGLVEVKNAPRTNDKYFGDDVAKLECALDRWGPAYGGSLKWGVFLFSGTRRRDGHSVCCVAVQEELDRRLESLKAMASRPLICASSLVSDEDDCCLGWGAVQLIA